MRKASIDLGTNTCLLLIADFDAATKRVVKTIHDQSTMVRLGQGVDRTHRLHPDAVERTRACLRGYAAKLAASGLKPSETICVATATARDAENGAEFFTSIEKEFGLRFRTISGEDEAKYMFLGGLLPEMDVDRSAVVDIGGGSTELRARTNGLSLQMGSVRFTERFLKTDPVTDEEFWACREAVDTALAGALPWRKSLVQDAELVAVAGTAVTLAQYQLGLTAFDPAKIDGLELTRGDIHRMVEELKWRSVAERKALPGIEEGRADVILAGALILWRSLEVLGFPKLKVSTRGLRYGVLAFE
jgi:exopolyphosphatase/guanosine-5'-triphosphate,3'-diphosphate pyrophosphatase